MYRGEIVALVDGPTAEREEVGLLMAAGRRSIPPTESASSGAGRAYRRCRHEGDACPHLGLAAIPLVSIVLALLLGSILIILSSLATEKSLNLLLPLVAYESLLQGATGLSFIDVTGGTITFALSINPDQAGRALTNTHGRGEPALLTGLAVGVGFKAGLFNIGGTGQVLVGGFFAGLVGRGRGPAAASRSRSRSRSSQVRSAERSTGSSRAPSRRSPARTRSCRRSCSTPSPRS